MRSKAILLALLALAYTAQAREVTQSEAARAARAWVRSGETLGVRFGTKVDNSKVHTFAVANGVAFHAVPVDGGGTVFISGDTEAEPIVAFSTGDSTEIDKGSPLYDLLCLDAKLRAYLASRKSSATAASGAQSATTKAAAGSTSAAARKWAALLGEEDEVTGRTTTASGSATGASAPISSINKISDLRVAPLLTTKWSQIKSNGSKCYNYYTPKNYPCGCTATAAGQIMRHFQHPAGLSEVKSFECVVDKVRNSYSTLTGAYDWANMADSPMTDVQRKAVGHLTYDIAIALQSEFTADGTGADPLDLAKLYTDTFDYANAFVYWDNDTWNTGTGGLHNDALRNRVIYPNLDAGCPVQLAIYGYDKENGVIVKDNNHWVGHSVVADGYGFTKVEGEQTAYVHINLGWAGADDAWYNIPEIDTSATGATISSSGSDFLYLGGAAFNISPYVEDKEKEIISGRVTDDEGAAVEGAVVGVINAENNALVATTVTDANGIYAVRLSGGSNYDMFVRTADGGAAGEFGDTIRLRTTVGDASGVVASSANVGNYWGADMTLFAPTVRIGANVYSSLSLAIADADDGDTIEILQPTTLKGDVVVNKTLTITAVGDAAAAMITRESGAAFTVAEGAALTLSNVAFSEGARTVVSVAAGGQLAISGLVDFGVQSAVAAVRTTAADGLKIVGGLDAGFTLDCAEASDYEQPFGIGVARNDGEFAALAASVARIANAADKNGELRGAVRGEVSPCELYWKDAPVPFEDAAGYFVDADGVTNTAARIDRLLEKFDSALASGRLGAVKKIVIRQDGELTYPLTVGSDLILTSDGVRAPELTAAGTAGFTVTDGKLSVSGIKFKDYKGNALFMVNGSGASLDIDAGTLFDNIEGTNFCSGAITVLRGSAKLVGTTFNACRATGKYKFNDSVNSDGGAIYLASNTLLTLGDGCVITNCSAAVNGGAIYAEQNARVILSGQLMITNNISGNMADNMDDDIYLVNPRNGNNARLEIAGVLTGSVGLRWCSSKDAPYGSDAGQLLATAATAADACRAQDVLFQNRGDLVARADGSNLRWATIATGPQPCAANVASAKVIYDRGGIEYYELVTDALKVLRGDATVEIMGENGNHLDEDILIVYNVTLKSAASGSQHWIDRTADCSVVVDKSGSLTLKDVSLYGTKNGDVADETAYTKPLIDVSGGVLTLATPSTASFKTEIANVHGDNGRNACAVSVWNNGVFNMHSGVSIHDCVNDFFDVSDGNGHGGALLVDNGTANLSGGTITGCRANNGGGVFIGNGAQVRISGDVRIEGNYRLDGKTPNNLVVADLDSLQLVGKLTGKVGYTEGYAGSVDEFGLVAYGGADSEAVTSAHNFTHDTNGDIGMVVKSGAERLLVWSSAIDLDGTYTDSNDGAYNFVDGEKVKAVAPTAVSPLVYNGEEQIGVPQGIGYVMTGNSAVKAGAYTATATLRPGFTWTDGTTAAKKIPWSIAKADYDMSGVTFEDETVVYDGEGHSIEISGTMPKGVTVEYIGNCQTNIGVYTVTAEFTGDAENYKRIEPMTATLTIVDNVEPPPPPPPPDEPSVQTNTPGPINFKDIVRVSETEWTLIMTNRTPLCDYRLIWTDDLRKGFTSTGAWERAAADVDPVWTTNITSETSAKFWKVEAQETITPIEK